MSKEIFTRREILSFGGRLLAVATLSACGRRGNLASATPYYGSTRAAEPTQNILEIKGKFPADRFAFGQIVLKHDLVPQTLPEMQWAYDRMKSGVDYLQRVAAALIENPQYNLATLGNMSVVSEKSFPIACLATTTVLDLIQYLVKDIADKKVILWGASYRGVPYLAGTVNNPKYQTGLGWYMESQIHTNADFPFGGPRSEESDTTYSQYTDLQVGLKMIHEYSHCRQGQQLLSLVLAEHETDITSRNNDVNYISNLIDAKANYWLALLNSDPKINRVKVRGEVAFNEAQANQISQSVLWVINKLNEGKRMPGTEDDSYPVSPGSLYQTFQRAVVNDKNPYDSGWLNLHVNWGGG